MKRREDSYIESRHMLLPKDTNPAGNAFGGRILEWIDGAAAMAAQKHCSNDVVTASLDSIVFLCPVKPGDHVVLIAYLTYAGRSSMEVKVDVFRESPYTSERSLATTAFVTMISLAARETGKPVPMLQCETDAQKTDFAAAEQRMIERKKNHADLKHRCF